MRRSPVVFSMFCILLSIVLMSCSSGDGGGSNRASSVTDSLGYDLSGVQVDVNAFSILVDSEDHLAVTFRELSATVRKTGGESSVAVEYRWSLPEGCVLSEGSSAADANIRFHFPSAGQYLLSVTATDADGRTSTSGAAFNVVEPSVAYTIGDLSGDGALNDDDVELLGDIVAGAVQVTANQLNMADINLDHQIDENDLGLLADAVAVGDAAPTYISTSEGSAGSTVFVIHPALLDPLADVGVRLDALPASTGSFDEECIAGMTDKPHWNEVTFIRSQPGYLVFRVPIRYSCLTSAETVRVLLDISNGGDTYSLSDRFTIHALPEVGGEPGDLILDTMAQLRRSLESLPDGLAVYADSIDATDEEKAFLVGSIQGASRLFNEYYGKFYIAFQQLDAPTRKAWEQMARARGLTELSATLSRKTADFNAVAKSLQTGRTPKLSAQAGESIVSLICSFNDILDIAGKISDINQAVADTLEYLDWFPLNVAPVVGPTIQFLSRISDIISTVTDIISSVGRFVPKLGDTINVTVTHAALVIGHSTGVAASIAIKIVSGLCNLGGESAVGSLIDGITDMITKRIGSSVPGLSSLFNYYDFVRDEMDWATGYLYDAIGSLAGEIVDASGLQDYMNSLVARICDLFGDPELPLETDFLRASCSSLVNSVWTCTEECGAWPQPATVSFSGNKPICGNPVRGQASVTCLGSPPPESLTARVGSAQIEIGGTTTASARYSRGDENTDVTVQWSSSNSAVASVQNNGAVSGNAVGVSTLTATYVSPNTGETLTATTAVTVFDPNFEQYVVSLYNRTILIGGTTHLSATYTRGLNTSDVTADTQWTSSNPGVASVGGNGVITGLTPGSTTFTGNYTAPGTGARYTYTTAPLTVQAETLDVILEQDAIQVGQTTQARAFYKSDQGATDVTGSTNWEVCQSNAQVASINQGGEVTGNSAGAVNINGWYTSPNTGEVLYGSALLTVQATAR